MEEVTSKRRPARGKGGSLAWRKSTSGPGIFQCKCLGKEHAGRSCGKEVSA